MPPTRTFEESMTMRAVYLHGFLSSHGSTKSKLFAKRLAGTGVELLVPDLNEPSFSKLSISRVIEKATSLLDPSGPNALIGSSMGGWAAAHLASLRPEHVSAIVLMAPAFNMPGLLEERLGEEGMERWRLEGTVEMEHPAFETAQRLEHDFIEDAREWAARPLRVRCPTLILHGRGDEDVPVSLSELFASRNENVELVTYEAGHALDEVVEDVIDRATSFLENIVPHRSRA